MAWLTFSLHLQLYFLPWWVCISCFPVNHSFISNRNSHTTAAVSHDSILCPHWASVFRHVMSLYTSWSEMFLLFFPSRESNMIGDFLEVGLGASRKRRGGNGDRITNGSWPKNIYSEHLQKSRCHYTEEVPYRAKVGEINGKMNILRQEVLMKHPCNSTIKTIIIITIKY